MWFIHVAEKHRKHVGKGENAGLLLFLQCLQKLTSSALFIARDCLEEISSKNMSFIR